MSRSNPRVIQTLLKEYHGNTRPAEDFGYKDDAKRLRREFSDEVHLRWHLIKHVCQVWHRSFEECMLLCQIEAPYDICRAIRFLKDKEKSRRQNLAIWQQNEADEKADRYRKTRAVAEEVGTAYKNAMNGKISMRMR